MFYNTLKDKPGKSMVYAPRSCRKDPLYIFTNEDRQTKVRRVALHSPQARKSQELPTSLFQGRR